MKITDKSAALSEASKELEANGENGATKKSVTEKKTSSPKKAIAKTTTPKQEPKYSEADVKQLLEQQKEFFKEESKKLEERLNGKITEFNYNKKDDDFSSDADINDVLKEPAIFFSTSQGKSIMDDVRHGRTVFPPFSYKNEEGVMITVPFRFVKLSYQEKFGTRNRKEIMWTCICKVSSKKRAKWLREHTMFGYAFFEKIESLQTVDSYIQEKLVEAAMMVKGLSNEIVWQRCMNDPSMTMDSNIEVMRRQLASKIAENSLKNEGDKARQIAINSKMAQIGIGQDNAENIMAAK
jgi:hypothetical protein